MFTCTLDPLSRETLTDQLYHAFCRGMADGSLPAGKKLPSKRELSEHLGISTSTVEAAYGRLIEEGRCESRPRSGIYVLPPEKAVSGIEKEPEIRWDFGTGAADAERFPYATWAKLMREVLGEESTTLLRAGDARGSEGLRTELSGLLRRMRGIEVPPECLVLGAGTEVLVSDLLGLIGRDRLFAVEDPGYPRVRRILASGGARLMPVPLAGGAPDLRTLYACGAGALYVTPTHQFPTGTEMDNASRRALLAWSRETGGILLEDDYDSEFRFDGENVPAMRAGNERVVYLNTFSRMLAPGLRMAFMALPEALAQRYLEQHAACSVPAFEQETLRKFIAGGYLERHVARMRTVYRARLTLLEEEVRRLNLGTLHPCRTGLYALLEAGGRLPASQLLPRARRAGVNLPRVADYYIMQAKPEDRSVLLGFAGMDEDAIRGGLAALAEAWK